MKITIRLIALVIIGSLMSTGVSAQNIPNADTDCPENHCRYFMKKLL